MLARDVGDIFRGLKMLLAIGVHASLDTPRIKEVRNQQCGLKSLSRRVEMEGSSPEIENALRSPATAEQMEKIRVDRLVAKRVVAIKGGQALTGSSSRNVLVPLVVAKVSEV